MIAMLHSAVLPVALSVSLAQDTSSIGPAPVSFFGGSSGRLSAIVASPSDPDLYYAGAADGGLWRTRDGGTTWIPLLDEMPTLSVGAVTLDPSDERTIYVGTGEANFANHSRYGLGIYKSIDEGDTWTHLAESTFAGRCISRIIVDPNDPQRLFASVTRAGGFPELAGAKGHPDAEGPLGVFRSLDGGATWTPVGPASVSTTDLASDPTNASVLYAGVGRIFGSPSNGLYKSVDGGDSWVRLGGLPSNVGRISVEVAPSDPDVVVVLLTNDASSSGGGASAIGAYRSENAGQSWSWAGSVDQASYGWYLSTVGIHPTSSGTVFYGGLEMRRYVDGAGANVTPPHVDIHDVAWDASNRLLVACDGGVYRSTDLGDSWTSLNTTISTIQFYAGISSHPTDEDWFIAGAQDNGSNRRSSDSTSWTTVVGGDGGWTRVDPETPTRVFAEAQGTGNLFRSTDGGDDFSYIGGDLSGRNCFLPPYVLDPEDPMRMLYATHRIHRSTNGGSSWSTISADLSDGSGAIRSLAIAPSDSQVVYASTNDGNVQVSVNGGTTFSLIRNDHPGWPRVTRELHVSSVEPGTMYLAGAVFGADQVLRTTDFGASWTVLDGDLPDVPVNVIATDDRFDPPTIFAGTDAGLWRSIDDGVHWDLVACGLPRAVVVDLLVEPDRDRVVVSTQGRGAWLVGLRASTDLNDDRVVDVFDVIAFLDLLSSNDPGADWNEDGTLDIFDVLAFLEAFGAPC